MQTKGGGWRHSAALFCVLTAAAADGRRARLSEVCACVKAWVCQRMALEKGAWAAWLHVYFPTTDDECKARPQNTHGVGLRNERNLIVGNIGPCMRCSPRRGPPACTAAAHACMLLPPPSCRRLLLSNACMSSMAGATHTMHAPAYHHVRAKVALVGGRCRGEPDCSVARAQLSARFRAAVPTPVTRRRAVRRNYE